jgi:hypothetical protein
MPHQSGSEMIKLPMINHTVDLDKKESKTFAVSCCVVKAKRCRAPNRASLRRVPALLVTTRSPTWKRVTPGPVWATVPEKHTAT